MNDHAFISLEHAQNEHWDVVIIGSGMGGACAAWELTRQGHRVLMIEKGQAKFGGALGVETEQESLQERLNNGWWPTQLTADLDGQRADFWAPLGCGLGGSTLLYAAALQRLAAHDFEAQETPDGRTVSWPFTYREFEPWYQRAEALFAVRGTRDPLEREASYQLGAPPAMCDRDRHFFQEFQAAGLHPYRLHVAMDYVPDCGECGGQICARNCKHDALNTCIQPALATGRLFVLSDTEVERLDADKKQVRAVEVKHRGERGQVRGKIVVLSAGAYFSPVILQKSANSHWPFGLANASGQLGKNLMFHASDFIALWPKTKTSRRGPNKTIGLRDFYQLEGKRLGEFQSTGIAADFNVVLYSLRLLFDQSPFRKIQALRHFLRIPAWLASKLYGDATVFTTIVEDFPYEENRVVADPSQASGMRFEYSIHQELRERVMLMRKALKKRMGRLRSIHMNLKIILNHGHPCGTCKAGDDPRHSVLDKNCKAHGIDNLYVVDASFMPTSGGTNPSLTIAANALRVAEVIARELKEAKT